jgi:hypothetical protein
MSETIQPQHPAVVLRSHYVHLRALLGVAMIAVIGLTLALVLVASNNSSTSTVTVIRPATSPASTTFYGGHEEGLAGPNAGALTPSTRYDGGPEEGTAGH